MKPQVICIRFAPVLLGSMLGILSARLIHNFVPLFLYVCFIASFISGILTFLLLKFANTLEVFKRKPNLETMFLYSVISTLTSLFFLTTIPLNVDRSFSVWSLSQVYISEEKGDVLSEKELKLLASSFFTPEQGEITRRIREQVELGNLKREGNLIRLTNSGRRNVIFFAFISRLFDLNGKYVIPK